jgi:large subunit ribosomal protein L21
MKYAIVESGGKQYKAVEGGTIEVDLMPLEAGQRADLSGVLLVVDGDKVSVGTPLVKGAKIQATVVGHIKGPKIDVFRYRPKKRIRVKTGHRQQYTRLQIESISVE